MASQRANVVAEVLWELKRAGKLARYTSIAERAGFAAGANGRAVATTLRTVRRDWPHLQWWRAVQDNGLLDKDCEQAEMLAEAGFEIEECDSGSVCIKQFEDCEMDWQDAEEAAEA